MTASGTSAPATGKYRPELDGIRAFCILFTIANHIPGTPEFVVGTVGVDVFFALSGWLITWLLMVERSRYGSISLKAFYIRRVFRIAPLYFATIALYFVAVWATKRLTGDQQAADLLHRSLPYLVTFNREYAPFELDQFFGHPWTLGIEEKFYILWPLILVFWVRWPRATAVAAVMVVIALFWPAPDPPKLLRGYIGLGVGAGLAVLAFNGEAAKQLLANRWTRIVGLSTMIVAYVLLVVLGGYWWNIVVACGAGLLISNLWLNPTGLTPRILSWGPLAFAGRLTYAMYLLHGLAWNSVFVISQKLGFGMPWLVLFGASYLVTFVAALIAHTVLEQPLINVGRRLASRPQRLATA